jgi:4a-hydroxytetrahydrobiopterin dehydratase
MAERPYEPTEVERRLAAELPRWRLEDGAIRRRFRTASWKGTLMVVVTVGHLAEAAWHHPDIAASYDHVDVAFTSHDAGGITERDLVMAARVEDVVAWRPGEQDGPLTGTPDDPRFAYVLPDEEA